MPARPYHHGDLRAALLLAADAELIESGIDGFTLRGCARRAGVSHSAPATFFRDVSAFLSELAAISFEELTLGMQAAAAETAHPVDRMIAVGRAYALFALRKPAHFRLMWRNERLDKTSERLRAASAAAFAVPVDCIALLYGNTAPMADPMLAGRVVALWSMIHGVTELLISGQLDAGGYGSPEATLEAVLPPMISEHFSKSGTRK